MTERREDSELKSFESYDVVGRRQGGAMGASAPLLAPTQAKSCLRPRVGKHRSVNIVMQFNIKARYPRSINYTIVIIFLSIIVKNIRYF